ncbi:hypothetical protein DL96DRAFT_682322 [Flagelloscypha sp. PMI_526]|nr:hypothetical protein DL96DRAFT_682322 [Flagelloscypha sp. PMI_526]
MPSNYNFRYFVSFARVSLSLTTLDGGSQEIPSFSQLAILEEVLSRIAFDLNIQVDDAKDMRPADFFELFAGTGFGGLSVIFFTRLNFTLSQALESHRILHDQLLATPDWIKGDMESCSATLQRLLDVITRKHGRGIILDDYLDDPRSPKGFVCAMNPTTVTTPRLLRTYRSRTNFGPRCTIRQAACTALADQLHLPAIQIPDDGETFIGAHLGFNNPTGVVLPEIPNAFPKAKHVSCIVNLGAGHAGFATIPAGGPTLEVLRKAAQDCEKVAESILSRSYNLPGLFHRLSVEHGVQTSFVASTPIATRATIASHTKAYLELTLTSDAVDKLVESVVKPEATIPVKQLLSWAGPNEPAKMQKDVDHIRSSIDNQIFRDIQAWLKPLDQVEKHESAIEARTEGTCEWFLDHSSFTNWQDNPKSFLWVHGGMGTGKTTLFSSAVEFLSNVEGVLAYYYFDVRDSTSLTVRAMLVSLVCQAISTNWEPCPSILWSARPWIPAAKYYRTPQCSQSHCTGRFLSSIYPR